MLHHGVLAIDLDQAEQVAAERNYSRTLDVIFCGSNFLRCRVPSVSSMDDRETSAEAVEVLLRFGVSMLGAGNTAARTREWIDVMARKLGFDAVSVNLSLDSITMSVRSADQWITAMREIGPPGINVWRIAELEELAKTA